MKPNKFLSLFLCLALVFCGVVLPAQGEFDESVCETVIHNIAANCAVGDITEDGNFIWFLADMETYRRLYPESKNVLADENSEKCKKKLLEFAAAAEAGGDLAKSIIGFRALGYDCNKIYISDTEKLEIVAKLAALVDAKSNAVTNIYTLPYVAIAMREYASDEENAYLLKAMVKQKAKWQDMTLGTDAATPMVLALMPYYDTNEDAKAAVDETIPLILSCKNENGLIGNAPSTGLAIAALSAAGADTETVEALIAALMGEATPGLDSFLPTENSFGTEQGFRGLLAYKLGEQNKTVFDFSDYPKNELKMADRETENVQDTDRSQSHGSASAEAEKITVKVKIMTHDPDECNNSFTYKADSSKYTAITTDTLQIEKDCTVYDATIRVFERNGLSYQDKNGYIAEIDGISEFDHGEYSGWMFMVNGKHQTVGCNYVGLIPDSTILWFYTDDYRYEKGSESFGYSSKKKEADKQTADSEKKEIKSEEPAFYGAVSDTAKFLYDTVTEPQVSSIGGEWAVIGLSASGEDIPDEYFERYYKNVEKTVRESEGILHKRKYTEYSRVVLALTLIGKDPQNVAGYDLTEPICDFEKTVSQGLNGAIWALIALDSGNYENRGVRAKYLEYILSRELNDGGWALSADETAADCDVTAMALTALANHTGEKGVADAINRGLACLSGIQNADGGFSTYGEETAESTAQVVTALAALGIGKKDGRFVKNGKTPIDSLLSYYKDGKGFSHTKSGDPNLMATEQALCALASQKRTENGKSRLFNKNKFRDIIGNENETAIVKLTEKGIINGMSDTAFEPENSVTRAQFATMIVLGLGISGAEKTSFTDVCEDDWFYPYVGSAYKNGIVYGVSETEFAPYGIITCEEAAAMLERAAQLCGVKAPDSSDSSKVIENASDWAVNSLIFCIDTGILKKEEMLPKEILNRAKIAQMIYNMLLRAEYI